MADLVKTINTKGVDIIKDILKLHVPSGKIDCDARYGKGTLYKDGQIEEPDLIFDDFPANNRVVAANSTDLPLKDKSLNCILFNPPFLATKGKSLSKEDNNDIMPKFYNALSTEKELHNYYKDSLKEFYRVLKDQGILIFRCQDKVSGGTQYMSHCFIYEEAIKLGFYPKDLFILFSNKRPAPKWQTESQKNARKFHSYYWVFQKTNKVAKYI